MSAPAMARTASVQRNTELETKLVTDKESTGLQTEQASARENIARLAYALWQQRGCPEGSSETDWTEAERQLRDSSKQPSTPIRA